MTIAAFRRALSDAISEFSLVGFNGADQLHGWLGRLRTSAVAEMEDEAAAEVRIRRRLRQVYDRLVTRSGLLKWHADIDRFAFRRVLPYLRDEFDRRMMAALTILRLGRDAAIGEALKRFTGWATSVPSGGAPITAKARTDLVKAVIRAVQRHAGRMIALDQGRRLQGYLSAILANRAGAIAGRWRHHMSPSPRPEHLALQGVVLLIRDSWADQEGFVRPGPYGYADDHDVPGQLPNCHCTVNYIYNLRHLPHNMLTPAGRDEAVRIINKAA